MPHYDRTETRRILRKMDARLMPVLAFPYLMSFLDRSNIGNAKVAGMCLFACSMINANLWKGMAVDMGLSDKQYNICLMVSFNLYILTSEPSIQLTQDIQVFFFTYSLFEVPSNIVLKLVRPSWWITILMVSWGTVWSLTISTNEIGAHQNSDHDLTRTCQELPPSHCYENFARSSGSRILSCSFLPPDDLVLQI